MYKTNAYNTFFAYPVISRPKIDTEPIYMGRPPACFAPSGVRISTTTPLTEQDIFDESTDTPVFPEAPK